MNVSSEESFYSQSLGKYWQLNQKTTNTHEHIVEYNNTKETY